jgi:signal transduction histidine kinase
VKLQPGGLSQIVTNLVMNTLTHGFGAEDAGSIELSATELSAGVELVYRDNGKGMTPDVVDRIFDPFFTTRRGQGGSGLGMHVVYNIVTQKYGGEIRCESAPGKGTRFIITLPACRVATEKETASI